MNNSPFIYPETNLFSTGSGGSGNNIAQVNTFADLPPAASYSNNLYYVRSGSGVWLINRKSPGLYRSDGINWVYAGKKRIRFKNKLTGDGSAIDKNHIKTFKENYSISF